VTIATSEPLPTDLFAALLRGEAVPWPAFAMSPADFVRTCEDQSLAGLVYERVRRIRGQREWPRSIRDGLARGVRAQAATELLRQEELHAVLDALAADGVSVILVKGTALAYSLYDAPSSRPRVDTDLWIQPEDVNRVRRVMAHLGYTAPPYCDGEMLFCQFPLQRTTPFTVHRFDCHWKISTQAVFADVLTFDEIAGRAVPLPALGAHARALAPLDALLLACIHPVMHHRNAESLIWLFDIHLLASMLSEREFEQFAEMAIAKKVSAICARQLTAAKRRLGTRIPDSAIREMTAVQNCEASAVYLRPDRRWLDELMSSIRAVPRWRDRLRLMREVTVPGRLYMLKAYGFERSRLGVALLPLFHLHRLVFGGWKVVAGRK
jgi:putative nucleotidyltransferase-like protein